MLVIRREHLAALGRSTRRAHERTIAAHLRKHFAAECAPMDQAGLDAFVAHVCDRAESHGLSSYRDLAKYADVAMALGRDFDTDPAHPWARSLLADKSIAADIRADLLCQNALMRLPPDEE